MKPRLVCWYSHGVASTLAAKKMIELQPFFYPDHELLIVNIYVDDENQEPELFQQVSKWLGKDIEILVNDKFNGSVDEVIKKTRYMAGVRGARCTKELKKDVRKRWQRDDDVHVFGMTIDEEHRIDNILDAEPNLNIFSPLIELEMTKKDCFEEYIKAGLELPLMYKLGYHNNNCKGCLKARGAGYWNKIRVDFPPVFDKRSKQEELLNTALVTMSRNKFMNNYPDEFIKMVTEWDDRYQTRIVKGKEYHTQLIPLRYLPDDVGSHKDLDIGDCGFTCELK